MNNEKYHCIPAQDIEQREKSKEAKQDPELYIQQAMTDYKRLGYSDNWINTNGSKALKYAKSLQTNGNGMAYRKEYSLQL